jgi:sulfur carrier protein
MIVQLNGSRVELTEGLTLLDLIEARLGRARGAAVVVDGAVVPRSSWPSCRVVDGQDIELITAVQGG